MSSETKNSVDMRSLSEFDGRKENFGYFWTKLKAYLNVRGLAHVIKKTLKDVLPASEAKASTQAEKEAMKENSTVTGLFGIVITGTALLRKIEKMKTDEWPDGCGYLIADMLLNKTHKGPGPLGPFICWAQGPRAHLGRWLGLIGRSFGVG